ncbi:Ff.00g121830.m01.CDS01 [Fusarium sp. VM40]|nr:Ff.00g121830.m01.CDS01 [Fusarium sp. VM40]
MASFFKNAFGGEKAPAAANPDSDFADFAEAPSPAPEVVAQDATTGSAAAAATTVPFTKWYNVHERHSISEFKMEGVILLISSVVFLLHMIGARRNRSRAKAWIRAHAPVFHKEYALVGFSGVPTADNEDVNPETLIKEKSLFEFATYATGRQNTAFTDVKLTLTKKFNPIVNGFEHLASFFIESFDTPTDAVEVITYPFDGKENLTVPSLPGASEIRAKDAKSTYDGFVWGVVHKDVMRRVRDERYDVSLTFTKDNPKLPAWLTVMSESAEITDTLLYPELIAAIKAAGDLFEYIIISDQPVDKPLTLEETFPRKRLFLKYALPSSGNYDTLLPLFSHFLQFPDVLVKVAHFRPEVSKKVRTIRENAISELKKSAESQRQEELLVEKEKARKAKRDAELKGLDAKAQKRYLEKEKEKEMRKAQRRQTQRA